MEVQWKFNGESFYHMEISMFDFRSKCPKHESLIEMSKPGLGVHPANSSQPRFFPKGVLQYKTWKYLEYKHHCPRLFNMAMVHTSYIIHTLIILNYGTCMNFARWHGQYRQHIGHDLPKNIQPEAITVAENGRA